MITNHAGNTLSSQSIAQTQRGIAPNAPYMQKRSFKVNDLARKVSIDKEYLQQINHIRFNESTASRERSRQSSRSIPSVEIPAQTQQYAIPATPLFVQSMQNSDIYASRSRDNG
ncbi:MAG: hypothetical protein CMP21_01425 [Rickettsiales bacterium]|nr:hypothetical protein [Rickettsiales bacterium]|tara:strand:- start:201 stop:542 length:342 start_codon:yes stop_codon:yes gene_type:complete